ncbi:hypothetical protein GCM10025880_42700 [Methylorubrum aminovorans]|nr:hypothetical protein GCM10025880_42700 [Methylorubrum aminovorans]
MHRIAPNSVQSHTDSETAKGRRYWGCRGSRARRWRSLPAEPLAEISVGFPNPSGDRVIKHEMLRLLARRGVERLHELPLDVGLVRDELDREVRSEPLPERPVDIPEPGGRQVPDQISESPEGGQMLSRLQLDDLRPQLGRMLRGALVDRDLA